MKVVKLTPDSLDWANVIARYRYDKEKRYHYITVTTDNCLEELVCLVDEEAEKLLEVLTRWKEGR